VHGEGRLWCKACRALRCAMRRVPCEPGGCALGIAMFSVYSHYKSSINISLPRPIATYCGGTAVQD
jgi:hypothetical protein